MKKRVKYLIIMLIGFCIVLLSTQMEIKATESQKNLRTNGISSMWNYLSSYGITGSVTLPVTVLIDSNNMVQNIMTGYHTANEILAEINRFKNADTSVGTNTGTVTKNDTKKPKTSTAIVRKKNDIINDKKTNGKYRIITTNNKGGNVEYRSPINKKRESVQIPATINIDGKSYKVTGIAVKAFKGIHSKAKIKVSKNKVKTYQKLLRSKGVGVKVEISK